MNPMVDSLQAVPLFADLSRPRSQKRLADSMKERSFAPGDEVVAEGKSGVVFFVLFEGSARVSQGGEDRGRLTTGDYFGEMALIDGDLRLASVHAEEDLRCATLDAMELSPVRQGSPRRGVGAAHRDGQAGARSPGAAGRHRGSDQRGATPCVPLTGIFPQADPTAPPDGPGRIDAERPLALAEDVVASIERREGGGQILRSPWRDVYID